MAVGQHGCWALGWIVYTLSVHRTCDAGELFEEVVCAFSVLIFDQRMCANFLLDVPHCVAGRNVEPYFYYFNDL